MSNMFGCIVSGRLVSRHFAPNLSGFLTRRRTTAGPNRFPASGQQSVPHQHTGGGQSQSHCRLPHRQHAAARRPGGRRLLQLARSSRAAQLDSARLHLEQQTVGHLQAVAAAQAVRLVRSGIGDGGDTPQWQQCRQQSQQLGGRRYCAVLRAEQRVWQPADLAHRADWRFD